MNALSTADDDADSSVEPLVSVVINNYNYATYLADAIDSALQQDYAQTEVIVVDDGSTDHSRDIIAGFGAEVAALYKNNGGQASALNAGFVASRGDVILFLDADDVLLPSAVTSVVNAFCEPGISNVHWPMWMVDADGNRTGGTKPSRPPAEGDFREQLLARGPSNLPCSPTSGNAWSREFLRRVLPIPEDVPYYRLCADEYLYTLAPAFGRLRTIAKPQSCYRIHGQNVYSGRSFHHKLRLELDGYDQQCRAVSAALARNGILVDRSLWSQHSWFHRLERAVSDILRLIPEHANLVLVESGTWDASEAFGSRNVRPYFCSDGVDWGPPVDCEAAICQLQNLIAVGMQYLVIAWPSFWWFEAYPRFSGHLDRTTTCIFKNDAVAIFDLSPTAEIQGEFEHPCGQTEEVHDHG